jgi:hypothetical protein
MKKESCHCGEIIRDSWIPMHEAFCFVAAPMQERKESCKGGAEMHK